MAQLGSASGIAENALIVSGKKKECSMARARSNCFCASGEHEVLKSTRPSFSWPPLREAGVVSAQLDTTRSSDTAAAKLTTSFMGGLLCAAFVNAASTAPRLGARDRMSSAPRIASPTLPNGPSYLLRVISTFVTVTSYAPPKLGRLVLCPYRTSFSIWAMHFGTRIATRQPRGIFFMSASSCAFGLRRVRKTSGRRCTNSSSFIMSSGICLRDSAAKSKNVFHSSLPFFTFRARAYPRSFSSELGAGSIPRSSLLMFPASYPLAVQNWRRGRFKRARSSRKYAPNAVFIVAPTFCVLLWRCRPTIPAAQPPVVIMIQRVVGFVQHINPESVWEVLLKEVLDSENVSRPFLCLL